ncbi:hypothetical protein [Streptacidiphilus fuscans]|uniref:Uncharacterized protein n=1 Tax=Streptacidiphilus fuscans TaxID=2789292 RepID=A0A931FCI5_9ACTN|nr:hypothetical protein [Streptacidiphilus fuscans]MBF9067205.1 hypothetical protein [Streptacidiphilus fuscans]
MAPTLVSDVQPVPEKYEDDPRFHAPRVLVITEPVPAGWWISVGSSPDTEVVQIDTCEFAEPHYLCRLATPLAKPHAAGEPVGVIGELPD